VYEYVAEALDSVPDNSVPKLPFGLLSKSYILTSEPISVVFAEKTVVVWSKGY
jgi:hypothetical protein